MSTATDAPAPTAASGRNERLARVLRATASHAAERIGGGVVLVFAAAPGESGSEAATRLRAAAGFGTAQEARDAATLLLPKVREALEADTSRSFGPVTGLSERAAGGLLVLPLVCEENTHGALVAGFPGTLDAGATRLLHETAEVLALRFDHARLAETEAATTEEDKSEEILKLSEALFAQDIELLRSNEKLTKIEKLKNDFIERMSRELRTPLNSIIETIISVLTGENESLSESSKEALRSALDDGTSFLRTLQNILDLWRIKQGELPVEIQDVNLRETVEEAIFSVQDMVSGKPLVIEQDIPEHLPKFRTDLTKLNQVLFLLLENAVKFTPRGKVTIAATLDGGTLECQMRDTGVGICPDDRQFIFDEFYQVDEPASRRYTGAGLGLTLVRDLVVLLDGEISVASEVGAGSTFTFRIPVQL